MDRISTATLPASLSTNEFIRLDTLPYFLLFPDKPLMLSAPWLNLVPAKLETEFVKVFEVVSNGVQKAWAFQPLTKRVRHGPGHLLFHSSALEDRKTLLDLSTGACLQLRYALPDWHYLSVPNDMVMLTVPPKRSLIETLES